MYLKIKQNNSSVDDLFSQFCPLWYFSLAFSVSLPFTNQPIWPILCLKLTLHDSLSWEICVQLALEGSLINVCLPLQRTEKQSEKNAQYCKGLTPATPTHLTKITSLKELLHNYSPKGVLWISSDRDDPRIFWGEENLSSTFLGCLI